MRLNEVLRSSLGRAIFDQLESQSWQGPSIASVPEIGAAIGTDGGPSRSRNDDRSALVKLFHADGRTSLCAIVCDGVGSTENGGDAAAVAIAAFLESMIVADTLNPHPAIETAIRYADAETRRILRGSGATTLAVVVFGQEGRALVAGVGDSRVYRWDEVDSSMTQLTVDDSLEGELARQKVVDRSLLDERGLRGSLLQAIGERAGRPDDLVLSITEHPAETQRFVLGTDGCWRVGETIFEAFVTHSPSAYEAVRRALAAASWFGGLDNATILVVDGSSASRHSSTDMARSAEFTGVDMWTPPGRLSVRVTLETVAPRAQARSGKPRRQPDDARKKARAAKEGVTESNVDRPPPVFAEPVALDDTDISAS